MTTALQHNYAFPLRIDAGSQQTAQTAYASHVEQMIEQVLLTAPGERVDLPQFGCGLRQLVFAPIDESLAAALKIQVLQALGEWLAGVIDVAEVSVVSSTGDATLEPGKVQITVSYNLIETQTNEQTTVTLL
jgi:phage baseplate assembly protein W